MIIFYENFKLSTNEILFNGASIRLADRTSDELIYLTSDPGYIPKILALSYKDFVNGDINWLYAVRPKRNLTIFDITDTKNRAVLDAWIKTPKGQQIAKSSGNVESGLGLMPALYAYKFAIKNGHSWRAMDAARKWVYAINKWDGFIEYEFSRKNNTNYKNYCIFNWRSNLEILQEHKVKNPSHINREIPRNWRIPGSLIKKTYSVHIPDSLPPKDDDYTSVVPTPSSTSASPTIKTKLSTIKYIDELILDADFKEVMMKVIDKLSANRFRYYLSSPATNKLQIGAGFTQAEAISLLKKAHSGLPIDNERGVSILFINKNNKIYWGISLYTHLQIRDNVKVIVTKILQSAPNKFINDLHELIHLYSV